MLSYLSTKPEPPHPPIPSKEQIDASSAFLLSCSALAAIVVNQAVKPVTQQLAKLWKFKRKIDREFETELITGFYDRISSICDAIEADYATIYKLSNGGKKLTQKTQNYVTRIGSVNSYNADITSGDSDLADSSHWYFVNAMRAKGAVFYTRTELEQPLFRGKVKFIAHNENLAAVVGLPLGSDGNEFFFIVFKYLLQKGETLANAEPHLQVKFKQKERLLERSRTPLIHAFEKE